MLKEWVKLLGMICIGVYINVTYADMNLIGDVPLRLQSLGFSFASTSVCCD